MRLKNRLLRLEHSLPEPGCLVCCDRRGRIVLVDCDKQRDGPWSPCNQSRRPALRAPAPFTVRLGAARGILEMGRRVREDVELEQRLAALQEQLAATPA